MYAMYTQKKLATSNSDTPEWIWDSCNARENKSLYHRVYYTYTTSKKTKL